MKPFPRSAPLTALAIFLVAPLASAGPVLTFNRLWSHQDASFPSSYDKSAAEIVAHDAATQRVFVVNGFANRVDVLNAANGAFLGTLDVSSYGSPNSVATSNGRVAVAVQNTDPQANGTLVFFSANDATLAAGGTATGKATVGAMPDMVTFTPDGSRAIVANEGEPSHYGTGGNDPQGSVSIVDATSLAVTTASFNGFNKADLVSAGVRITGPGATAAQDIEPEYITVSPDGNKAYVTLQENNAIAEVDLATGTVSAIRALGTKDHNGSGAGLDASDRDNAINIANWPVRGMYMPDTIASYQVGGKTYLVTANEGDTRDYENPNNSTQDFTDEIRVGSSGYTLDPTAFPNATDLKKNANLGRLTVSGVDFDGSVPTTHDEILAFGTRSFSIWDAATGGLVFDSGDDFEQITAALGVLNQGGKRVFNSDNTDNDSFDNRSDNKGPEPEALVIGEILGTPFAFIGLERIGGIMVYDISSPTDPKFVDYLLGRNFGVDADTAAAGDLGPEGMYFLTPDRSPTGRYALLVANEVSGTTTYYDILAVPAPTPLVLVALGLPLLHLRRRSG